MWKKSTSFCQALKDAHKRKLVPVFFLPHSVYTTYIWHVFQIVGVIWLYVSKLSRHVVHLENVFGLRLLNSSLIDAAAICI